MPGLKKIAVLTSGGDAPGMNAAIRAVTRGALARGWEVFGVRNGYAGLLGDALEPLLARDVGGIVQAGGTMLGSARCPEFAEPAGRSKALENLKTRGIHALVVIGGNGSQSGSASLAREGFAVVGVPSTIDNDLYGVGEHTDYGLLTILKQDMSGGLEIKMGSRWIDAPPIEHSFVCNLGDMLDRMTGGRYLSTPHRVRNPSQHDRTSFAFFFDPDFEAVVEPIVGVVHDNKSERWDHASVHEFQGTYGDYLLGKVSKVFPQLRREVL